MFSLSKTAKTEVEKNIEKMLKTGVKTMNLEGFEMYVTLDKNQPQGTVFLSQIEKNGRTFYVCQKII
jgi:hypothetical protein